MAIELVNHSSKPMVIVITALTEQRLERDLLARGVAEIFHKPIDHTKLVERVLQILAVDSEASTN